MSSRSRSPRPIRLTGESLRQCLPAYVARQCLVEDGYVQILDERQRRAFVADGILLGPEDNGEGNEGQATKDMKKASPGSSSRTFEAVD